MGRELYEAFPVFADGARRGVRRPGPLPATARCGRCCSADGTPELLDQTGYTQPALFAVEVALFRLLRVLGRAPRLLGRPLHRRARRRARRRACCPCADAAPLVAARGRLMQALPAGGAMVAVQAAEAEVAAADASTEPGRHRRRQRPDVGGGLRRRAAVLEAWPRAGAPRAARPSGCRVSHAFHSPLMEPMLDEFRRSPQRPDVPRPGTPGGLQPDRRARHRRRADRPRVLGARTSARPSASPTACGALRGHGVTTFLELGPDGVLTAMAQDASPAAAASRLRRRRCAGTGPSPTRCSPPWPALHVRGRRRRLDAVLAGTGAPPRRPADLRLPARSLLAGPSAAPRPTPPPARRGADAAEARFWAAVEREDLAALRRRPGRGRRRPPR